MQFLYRLGRGDYPLPRASKMARSELNVNNVLGRHGAWRCQTDVVEK